MLDRLLAPLATKYAGTITKDGLAQDPSLQFVTVDQIRVRVGLWRLGGIEQTRFELTTLERLPRFHVDTWFLANLPASAEDQARAFARRCDDAALVRRIWTQPFARAIVALGDARIESKGMSLVIDHEGASSERLDALLEQALQIVRFDTYGTRVVAALPEATLVAEGEFVHAEVPGPSRILVGPVTVDDVTRTRVTLSGPVIEVSEDVRHRIEQLGATVDKSPEATSIVWPTIEAREERLLAAIMILRQLASSPSLGAFR